MELETPESMTIAAELVGAQVKKDHGLLAALLAPMGERELRKMVNATAALGAAMLVDEAEATDADPEAPAARAWRLFAAASRFAREDATD